MARLASEMVLHTKFLLLKNVQTLNFKEVQREISCVMPQDSVISEAKFYFPVINFVVVKLITRFAFQ